MTTHPVRSADRRRLLAGLPALLAAASSSSWAAPGPTARGPLLTRRFGRSGSAWPVLGLGSWITFNVGDDPPARARSADVMRAFFEAGGALIDSSPMYGSSQQVIGSALRQGIGAGRVVAADKVWTGSGARAGAAQVEASRRHWGVERFDLLQVHNLLDWEEHLPVLFEMRAAGRLRHVGITTSHGRRHRDVEAILRRQPVDVVQLTYNPVDRDAEQRLLPLAAERGIGVIVNRPYRGGSLLEELRRHRLPDWAAEIDCASWAEVLLKFAISHPAVTCAIPATSRVDHLRENMRAGSGRMPDAELRRRIAAHVSAL